jgi:hypothetical protein
MFMSVLRISLDSLTFTSIPFLQMERMGHSGTGPFKGVGNPPLHCAHLHHRRATKHIR